jgi:hypothetical protein
MSAPTPVHLRLIHLKDCPPDRVLDGKFGAYVTAPGFPQESSALELLRTLASIVEPVMKRHGLTSLCLNEYFATNPQYLGLNTVMTHLDPDPLVKPHKHWYIEIRLRPHDNHSVFLPLSDILRTMCHELAHCWYTNHTVAFLRECKSVMEEVDEDLGSTLEFRHLAEECPYKDIMDDLETDTKLRMTARSRAWAGRRGIGDPRAMLAAKLWQKAHEESFDDHNWVDYEIQRLAGEYHGEGRVE